GVHFVLGRRTINRCVREDADEAHDCPPGLAGRQLMVERQGRKSTSARFFVARLAARPGCVRSVQAQSDARSIAISANGSARTTLWPRYAPVAFHAPSSSVKASSVFATGSTNQTYGTP